MAKQKLTRKSYKRNIIVFGLMFFMGIALVSTGFAAWVLSQDTSVDAGGNVEVGIVSDNELKITDLKYYTKYDATDPENEKGQNIEVQPNELSFNFEPTEDDTTGNVKNDGENFEQLSLFIVGKIAPMNFIDDFIITMTFDLPAQIQAAVDAKYIQLPECAAPGGVNIMEAGVITDSASIKEDGTFVIEVSFEWGEYFNYMNPGKYYDETDAGKAVEYDDMKAALQNLRTYVYNSTYDAEGVEQGGQAPKFTILISVTAK